MTDHDEDRLLDHSYDGIQEYDNPMPRWWLWIFYATIAYSVAYYFLPLPFGQGPGAVAEYEMAMAKHEAVTGPGATDEELLALATQGSVLADGKALYAANCAACHRLDGGGLIGPNLADNFFIYGGAPTDIHRVIAEGVLAKGMPPWERILRPEQVNAVTAYVISLHGTNPPNPKAPEGVEEPTGT